MSHPTLPPYLGTWEHLLQELLHNPFLGGGSLPGRHPLMLERPQNGPSPVPWSPITSLMVMAAGLRNLAEHLPESQRGLAGSISQTVSEWDDWFCGTPPHPWPWVIAAAGDLLSAAGNMPAGGLRTSLVSQATRILEKAYSGEREEAKQVTPIAS